MSSLSFPQNSNSPKHHYIFGYGSLINKESRQRTLQKSQDAIPVKISGFERSWSYRCNRKDYTAVSVSRQKNTQVNGVLVKLDNPEADLLQLDAREIHYARGLIDSSSVEFLGAAVDLQNALIWVYENHDPAYENYNKNSQTIPIIAQKHAPCPNYPIPQSYVDCILSGCLIYGVDFAQEFVRTTGGWTREAFLQDRTFHSNKKYQCRHDLGEKPILFCPKMVDSLLSDVLFNVSIRRASSSSRL